MAMKKAEAIRHISNAQRGDLGALGTVLRAMVEGQVRNPLGVEAGTGIDGIAETYETQVERVGDLIRTTILIDLTGLRSTAAGDIIGDDGAGTPCHLGQITAQQNGNLVAGSVICLETPAGGDPDIDLYSATEATGVEDAAVSTLTETALTNGGDHVAGDRDPMTALPADLEYLYLVAGATTDADYTAGKLLIELWGTPAS